MAFSFLHPRQRDKPYTVREVNEGLASIIESGNTVVWVEGEISNYKRATSGHSYFSLKDEQSRIPAVLWRSNAVQLQFEPEDGQAVMVIASIRVYQKGGYYQLDVHRMQPAGVGALFAAYEKLKKKLEEEGLFDPAHKKELPATVSTLGVVTAKSGAALRDIIKVVAKRAPQTTILLHNTLVQGEAAPAAIVKAIRDLNDHGQADCIIVGRGGGSVEDLWAFNDERVARAIYASDIPIVSAVGHEVDFTIADFVADLRAPTPSAAAELVVSDQQEQQRYVAALAQRFSSWAQRYFVQTRENYESLLRRAALRRPVRMLNEARQECDELQERHVRALAHLYRQRQQGLRGAAARLDALSPLKVLSRGYSVVQKQDGGKAVRKAVSLTRDERVRIRFHQGEASARIEDVRP